MKSALLPIRKRRYGESMRRQGRKRRGEKFRKQITYDDREKIW